MKNFIKNLSDRINNEEIRSKITSEEATKHAYILPFFQALGYDIFNPDEFIPEFIADVGIKRGEKVDYAIKSNDKIVMVVECKSCGSELNVAHESQLFRYFTATSAKFGLLTNGIQYKIYTDIQETNKMDLHPFLEFDLAEYDNINFGELEKFTKQNFNIDSIMKFAELSQCSTLIKNIIETEIFSPSGDFVRFIFKKTKSNSSFTEKTKNTLAPIIQSCFEDLIGEKIRNAFGDALENSNQEQQERKEKNQEFFENDKIVTTQEEKDAYSIVKAICAEIVSPERIIMRDAQTYCAILFDNNNRKPIVRLRFNHANARFISLFATSEDVRVPINSIEDIYQYKKEILATVRKYITD